MDLVYLVLALFGTIIGVFVFTVAITVVGKGMAIVMDKVLRVFGI